MVTPNWRGGQFEATSLASWPWPASTSATNQCRGQIGRQSPSDNVPGPPCAFTLSRTLDGTRNTRPGDFGLPFEVGAQGVGDGLSVKSSDVGGVDGVDQVADRKDTGRAGAQCGIYHRTKGFGVHLQSRG